MMTSAFDAVQHLALQAAFAHIAPPPRFVWWVARLVGDHRRAIRTAYSLGPRRFSARVRTGERHSTAGRPSPGSPSSTSPSRTLSRRAGKGSKYTAATYGSFVTRTTSQSQCLRNTGTNYRSRSRRLPSHLQLAAIGVRLNAAKSYLARSPEAVLMDEGRRGRAPMSFVALDSEGTLAEQHI